MCIQHKLKVLGLRKAVRISPIVKDPSTHNI